MSPLGGGVDIWGFFKISLRRVYVVSESDSSIFQHFGMWPIHFRPAGAAGMGCTHQAHRLKKKGQKVAIFDLLGSLCAWWVHILFGARFCVEPVKISVLPSPFATFV